MTSDFCLELLQQKVRCFCDRGNDSAGGQLNPEHLACEDFLEEGIALLNDLRNYEDVAQEAARRGIPVSGEVVVKIESMYRIWAEQSDLAERNIDALGNRSSRNLAKFHEASEFAKIRIAAFDRFRTIEDALSGRLFTEQYIGQVAQAISQ